MSNFNLLKCLRFFCALTCHLPCALRKSVYSAVIGWSGLCMSVRAHSPWCCWSSFLIDLLFD